MKDSDHLEHDPSPQAGTLRSGNQCEIGQDVNHDSVKKPSHLSFFDLPAEVRNMIYKYYFSDTFVFVNLAFTPELYHITSKEFGEKSWILRTWTNTQLYLKKGDLGSLPMVCKTIHAETRTTCLHESIIGFRWLEGFLDIFHSIVIPGLPARLPDSDRLGTNPFIHIKRLWLDLAFNCRDVATKDRNMKSMIQVLHNHMRLDELWITFDETSQFFVDDLGPTVLFHDWLLKGLCLFIGLKSFEIAYVETLGPYLLRRQRATQTLNKILHGMPDHLSDRILKQSRRFHEPGLLSAEVNLFIAQEFLKCYKKQEKKSNSRVVSYLKDTANQLSNRIGRLKGKNGTVPYY